MKVQLFDGHRMVDLFWIEHNGTDVYCAPTHARLKWSYHERGEYHIRDGRKILFRRFDTPLREVNQYVPITGFGLGDARTGRRVGTATPTSSSRRADARLVIDERSLDPSRKIQVTVGVLPANELALLAVGLDAHAALYPESLQLQQLLIVPAVTPWIVVAVYDSGQRT